MAAAHDRSHADADDPSLRLRRAPAAEAGAAGDSSGSRRENGVPGEARSPPNPQQQQHEMFCYRASAPAHRRVKESPLSSDAIFQQVSSRRESMHFFFLCLI